MSSYADKGPSTTNTDGEGKRTPRTGKFDGKDYLSREIPTRIHARTRRSRTTSLRFTGKKGGKATMIGRIGVAPDGKNYDWH